MLQMFGHHINRLISGRDVQQPFSSIVAFHNEVVCMKLFGVLCILLFFNILCTPAMDEFTPQPRTFMIYIRLAAFSTVRVDLLFELNRLPLLISTVLNVYVQLHFM